MSAHVVDQVCAYIESTLRDGQLSSRQCGRPAVGYRHDKRGCRYLCAEHATAAERWSMALGHSDDCKDARKK